MTEKSKSLPASRTLEKLHSLAGDASAARRSRLDRLIATLKKVEAAAKAAPGSKPRLYQVNYRIKAVKTESRGTSAERRAAMVEMLTSLEPLEQHISTSTWRISLHIASAQDIVNAFEGILLPEDFLAVTEVTDNRANHGDADLE